MSKSRITAFAAAVVLLAACSDKPDQAGESANDSAMANMPGMAKPKDEHAEGEKAGGTPTSLTLTAGQVTHGKIAWSSVTMGTASSSATIPGQITTNEDKTVRLGAPARGQVTSVAVSPGAAVTRGSPLVVLQSPDAGAAQSDVAKAVAGLSSRRAQSAYARAAKDRAERLLAIKAIPRQDYDRAVADDELAQSEVQQAEAELSRARILADQLGADASSNGTIVIRSPQDGVVLSRTAVPGTVVEAGSPLIVVANTSELWLVAAAPEQFTGLFRTGGQLRFVVSAYADTFVARLTALGAELDQSTRTVMVRGSVDSRGGRLKPGMLATVVVSGARQMPAVWLPDDAVQLMEGGPHVFLAAPDGKGGVQITRQLVVAGSRAGGRIAVTGGIKAGDVVITSGASAVKAAFLKGGGMEMEH